MKGARCLMSFLLLLLLLGCQVKQQDVRTGGPILLTDATFDREVLQSPQPVLVEMWSSTCENCEAMKPIVRDLAQEFAGRAKIAALNIESNRFTAEKLGVAGLPAFLLFHEGRLVQRVEGRQPKERLAGLLESVLNERPNETTADGLRTGISPKSSLRRKA